MLDASRKIKEEISSEIASRQLILRPSGPQIDPLETSVRLKRSILRAALTDFDFDQVDRKIVPVPFSGDVDDVLESEIAEDKKNLLDALAEIADLIVASLSEDSNLSERKLVKQLQSYSEQCRKSVPNPRLLNRLGTTISRAAMGGDFRASVNTVDVELVDGFSRDHLDLMRLYFKEALARAQEVDAAGSVEGMTDITGEEFSQVADIMEAASLGTGEEIVDASIPTILRDIAGEIRDIDESILLSGDGRRGEIFMRRKSEAFKNGGIYVGRFVFFAALLSSITLPGMPEIMTALSLMVGLTESFAPGSIRGRYERLRQQFQALPALPEHNNSDDEQA